MLERGYPLDQGSWFDSVSYVPLPVMILSPEGKLLHGNDLFVRMIGIPDDGFAGSKTPDPSPGLQQFLRTVLEHLDQG